MTPTLVALFALAGSAATTTPGAPPASLFGVTPGWCPNNAWERAQIRLSSHWHPESQLRPGRCSISVGPRDAKAPSRSFTFSTDGRLMVFDTYEPMDDTGRRLLPDDPQYERFNTFDRVTAARVFWVFPRVGELSVQIWKGRVAVTLPNGGEVRFDTSTGRVAENDGLKLTQARHVERGQAGGVELSEFSGLVLDAGYRLGGDPTSLKFARSVVSDAHGGACDLPNRVAFRYGPDGQPTLRFETDEALLRYLRRLKRSSKSPTCRSLRLDGLVDAVAGNGMR